MGRPLDLANTDYTLWNDKCDYHEIEKIHNLNSKDNNLIVLQLNIRSLLGKQNDLNMLLNKLCYKKSLPKIVLLSETHLNASKLRHVNVPNYKILSHHRFDKNGGGVAILVHKTLSIKEQEDLEIFNKDSFECTFLEIKRKMKSSLIIGSIYRPPNTKPKEFNDQYQLMMNALKMETSKEIILGMDHNLDLLKTNSDLETQHFIDINFTIIFFHV